RDEAIPNQPPFVQPDPLAELAAELREEPPRGDPVRPAQLRTVLSGHLDEREGMRVGVVHAGGPQPADVQGGQLALPLLQPPAGVDHHQAVGDGGIGFGEVGTRGEPVRPRPRDDDASAAAAVHRRSTRCSRPSWVPATMALESGAHAKHSTPDPAGHAARGAEPPSPHTLSQPSAAAVASAVPLGAYAMAAMRSSWASICSGVDPSGPEPPKSQTVTSPGPPTASRREAGCQARRSILAGYPVISMSRPLHSRQTWTLLSWLPEATCRPSGATWRQRSDPFQAS